MGEDDGVNCIAFCTFLSPSRNPHSELTVWEIIYLLVKNYIETFKNIIKKSYCKKLGKITYFLLSFCRYPHILLVLFQ